MALLMYLITVFMIGSAMYLAASASGLSVSLYWDAVSAIFVLVPTFCLSVASYSIGDLLNGFSNGFSDVKDKKLIKNSISLFEEMKNTCIMFGWIGTLIGWIIMSFSVGTGDGSMSDNTWARFGLSFGVSIITLLYGYLFSYIIFEPFKNQYIKKLNNLEN